MEPKESKLSITKLDIAAIILIMLFCFTLFLRHERVCALINPDSLKQYNEILGNKEKDFRVQKLGPGHMIFFQFKENKKSLGELYSLTDIRFVPDNEAFTIWKGEDKIKKWNDDTALIENMQRFRVRFKIPVPENKNLEGKTIKGALHLNLIYPALINYTVKTSTVHSETWNRPVSVHIFSKDELNILSTLTNQMMKTWLICLGLLLFPVLLILANHLKKYRKTHPPRVA